MMITSNLLGVLTALISAAVWGCGDFCGGYAARRMNQYQVVVVSAVSGLAVLVAAALLRQEGFPSLAGLLWATAAGLFGSLGMAFLYRGLSTGRAASVAPVAAVIGAGLPVLLHGLLSGAPGALKVIGFCLALVGIWLVSIHAEGEGKITRESLLIACAAGIGFGGFFFFLGQVEQGYLFTPLIVTRTASLFTGTALVFASRLRFPSLTSNPYALLTGILDVGGNLFFVIAKQFTRLDVAVVLSSLYPAVTVLLAGIVLHEKISVKQGVGLAVCLAAIALISV